MFGFTDQVAESGIYGALITAVVAGIGIYQSRRRDRSEGVTADQNERESRFDDDLYHALVENNERLDAQVKRLQDENAKLWRKIQRMENAAARRKRQAKKE